MQKKTGWGHTRSHTHTQRIGGLKWFITFPWPNKSNCTQFLREGTTTGLPGFLCNKNNLCRTKGISWLLHQYVKLFFHINRLLIQLFPHQTMCSPADFSCILHIYYSRKGSSVFSVYVQNFSRTVWPWSVPEFLWCSRNWVNFPTLSALRIELAVDRC